MKLIIVLCFNFFAFGYLNSQVNNLQGKNFELENLRNVRDSLHELSNAIGKKLISINQTIKNLEDEMYLANLESQGGSINAKTSPYLLGKLKPEPSLIADKFFEIPKGQNIKIYDFKYNYYLVQYI